MPAPLTSVKIHGIDCQLIHPVQYANGDGAIDQLQRAEKMFLYLPFDGKLVARPGDLVLGIDQEVMVQRVVAWLTGNARLPQLSTADQRRGWIVNLRHIAKYLEGLWMHRWQCELYPAILPRRLRDTMVERVALQGMLAHKSRLEDEVQDALALLQRETSPDTANWRRALSAGSEMMPERVPGTVSSPN